MNLKEFQATGCAVEDLSEIENLAAQDVTGPGRVYESELYIEGTPGNWTLTIGNAQYTSANLEEHEITLYEWAVDEGYLD